MHLAFRKSRQCVPLRLLLIHAIMDESMKTLHIMTCLALSASTFLERLQTSLSRY